MPEPERDIEKTLRAYAKKRQEQAGAPAELHPATRRLLQGEVARVRGKPRPKPGFWALILGSSWPQIAVRVAVFVLLASVATVLLLPPAKTNFELAKLSPRDEQSVAEKSSLQKEGAANRSVAKNMPAEASTRRKLDDASASGGAKVSPSEPPSAPAPSAADALEKDKLVASTADTAKKIVAEPTPTASGTFAGGTSDVPPLSPSGQPRNVKQENFDFKSAPAVAAMPPPAAARAPQPSYFAANNAAPAPATPPPVAVAVPSSGLAADRESLGARLDGLNDAANSITQRFARVNQSTKMVKSSKARVVLNSFRVVQNGNHIQVIDKDGSIYSGSVELPGEVTRLLQPQVDAITVPNATGGNIVAGKIQTAHNESLGINGSLRPLSNYFFRVSGTNRSLKQLVVFSGNFVPNAQIVPALKLSTRAESAVNNSSAPAVTPASMQLLNFQLQGQAVIGRTNQIEINALPVKP